MATQSPVSLRATSPPEPDVPGAMTIHTEEEIAVKGRLIVFHIFSKIFPINSLLTV